jgi:hypothetical protein
MLSRSRSRPSQPRPPRLIVCALCILMCRCEVLPPSMVGGRSSAEAGAAARKQNACGDLLWNCAVLADRTTRPLLIGPEENSEALGSSAIRISADRIAGGTVTILPGARCIYEMRFEPFCLWVPRAARPFASFPCFLFLRSSRQSKASAHRYDSFSLSLPADFCSSRKAFNSGTASSRRVHCS